MRQRVWVAVLIGVAFVFIVVGIVARTPDDDTPTFCLADALLGQSGREYRRSAGQGCRFVDESGEVITELDGRPVCYDDDLVVQVGPECE